jgi:hypothetical protein
MSPSRGSGSVAAAPQNTITATVTVCAGCPTNTATITRTPTVFRSRTPTRTPTMTGTPTGTRTPTATPDCDDWRVIPSERGGELVNTLYGVAVASTDDVWAVGNKGNYSSVDLSVLIEHWNGVLWSVVPVTNTGTLRGVTVIAPDDVWAVGYTYGDPEQTMTMHWDGLTWTTVPSPSLEGAGNYLYGVSAVGPDDVWAVGKAGDQGIIMHWDGTAWSFVNYPPIANSYLTAVAAAGPDDVWAVGSAGLYERTTLTMHWDGTAWSRVASPNPSTYSNALNAVTVVSPDDVWAAGWLTNGGSIYDPVILHWDGTAWSTSPIAGMNPDNPDTSGTGQLFGISAASEDEVWAVGWVLGPSRRNVVLGWNGSTWTRVSNLPQPSGYANELFAVAAVDAGEAWATGFYGDNHSVYDTLTLRYGPQCGTPNPTQTVVQTATPPLSTATTAPTQGTPEPTNTPGGPTSTSTATAVATGTAPAATGTAPAATNTPAGPTSTPEDTFTPTVEPTAMACSMQYSDVPSTSPFFSQVMCLSCMGLTNGYTDGTFRPNNAVTRGQLAKIVSNTAGFTEPISGQTFEDVAVDSTFYMYIERMASRGILGGYACGRDLEPCGEGNRPYFRPGANATRGQISKIVSNSAGLTETPTGQTFEDVPAGHTFYLWVERLAMHNMMSGYLCGGPDEPCGPESRPYFRPGNNATRGQTSKIVGNGFYPGCHVSAP